MPNPWPSFSRAANPPCRGLDVSFRTLFERHRAIGFTGALSAIGVAREKGINSVARQLTTLRRALARICERQIGRRA
jgi:hypothetical protein